MEQLQQDVKGAGAEAVEAEDEEEDEEEDDEDEEDEEEEDEGDEGELPWVGGKEEEDKDEDEDEEDDEEEDEGGLLWVGGTEEEGKDEDENDEDDEEEGEGELLWVGGKSPAAPRSAADDRARRPEEHSAVEADAAAELAKTEAAVTAEEQSVQDALAAELRAALAAVVSRPAVLGPPAGTATALPRRILPDALLSATAEPEKARARACVERVAAALLEPAAAGGTLPSCEGVGARVIFGQRGDESSFSHLSGPAQAWPFVAGADERLLRAGQRDQMELLELIGFDEQWVRKRIECGVEFRMVIFALADCGAFVRPTWRGILRFVEEQSPACGDKLRPHMDALQSGTFEEIVARGNEVEVLEPDEHAKVCSFEAYAAHGEDSLRHARAFLRMTVKCTALFAGDGPPLSLAIGETVILLTLSLHRH